MQRRNEINFRKTKSIIRFRFLDESKLESKWCESLSAFISPIDFLTSHIPKMFKLSMELAKAEMANAWKKEVSNKRMEFY